MFQVPHFEKTGSRKTFNYVNFTLSYIPIMKQIMCCPSFCSKTNLLVRATLNRINIYYLHIYDYYRAMLNFHHK